MHGKMSERGPSMEAAKLAIIWDGRIKTFSDMREVRICAFCLRKLLDDSLHQRRE